MLKLKLQACRPEILLNRDSNTDVFKKSYFQEHLQTATSVLLIIKLVISTGDLSIFFCSLLNVCFNYMLTNWRRNFYKQLFHRTPEQPFADVLQNNCLYRFCKIHWKTPARYLCCFSLFFVFIFCFLLKNCFLLFSVRLLLKFVEHLFLGPFLFLWINTFCSNADI